VDDLCRPLKFYQANILLPRWREDRLRLVALQALSTGSGTRYRMSGVAVCETAVSKAPSVQCRAELKRGTASGGGPGVAISSTTCPHRDSAQPTIALLIANVAPRWFAPGVERSPRCMGFALFTGMRSRGEYGANASRRSETAELADLVLKVLTAMGYGGAAGSAERLGRSGDEGLDGVIRQDPLGLDWIYVQAKRYAADRTVGRPDIQGFVGALHGAQADRGVFITTSRFSPDAYNYAEKVSARVILIDGQDLAALLVKHNIGAQNAEIFVLKRIDEDFFEEV
jgi:hypothetical protein